MLPNPDNYDGWRDFARELLKVIGDSGLADNVVPIRYIESVTGGGGGSGSVTLPAGYKMVWYNAAQASLFLGNDEFSPPTAANLFRIDTGQLADFAISAQKLRDGAVEFAKLFDGAVGESKLADLTVTNAKIRDLAVSNAKIFDATILGAKIADATIVTALLGDAQIVSAKIADLAVNEAKIANASISSAKIANLSVGAAHIIDGQIINAKIANQISSYDWDGNKGWSISKEGSIEGTRIVIRNADGSVAFASGVPININVSQISGLGSLATQNGVTAQQVSGLGTLALLNSISPGNTTGFGALATQNVVDLASQIFGTLPQANVAGLPALVTSINGLTDDNVIGVPEKSEFIRSIMSLYDQYNAAERSSYSFVEQGFGEVTLDQRVAAFQAYDLMYQYLNSLSPPWNSPLDATPIDGGYFRAVFVNLSEKVQTLVKGNNIAGSVRSVRTASLGFGSISAIDMLTSGNISTYIAGAAIGRALIANAAIGTANIDNAAITNALIADAAINNAKINDVSANKMRTGLLTGGAGNNYWDLDAGRIVQTTGNVRMVMGTAFGAQGNLMRWFGSTSIGAGGETIANSIWAEATDGRIYYGGQELSAGNSAIAVQLRLAAGTAAGTNEILQDALGGIAVKPGGKFRINAQLTSCISNSTPTTGILFRFYVNFNGGPNFLLASAGVDCDNAGNFNDTALQALSSALYTNPGGGDCQFLATATKVGGGGAGSATFNGNSIVERINAA